MTTNTQHQRAVYTVEHNDQTNKHLFVSSFNKHIPIIDTIPETRAPLLAPLSPAMAHQPIPPQHIDAEASLVCVCGGTACRPVVPIVIIITNRIFITPQHSLYKAVAVYSFLILKVSYHEFFPLVDPSNHLLGNAVGMGASLQPDHGGGAHWIVALGFTKRSAKS